jgi:hypothetical protein
LNRDRAAEVAFDDEAEDLFIPGSRGREWRIHTGPFPLIIPGQKEQLWLWRITNEEHYTAVVVRLAADVLLPEGELSARVADAVATRGQSAVQACLRWSEPPREIFFADPVGKPRYWAGRP